MDELSTKVVLEWSKNKRLYEFSGSCVVASMDAWNWLREYREEATILSARVVDGSLADSGNIKLLSDGIKPPLCSAKSVSRKYRLKHGCTWVLEERYEAGVVVRGFSHTVCAVNETMLIDWSMSQFTYDNADELCCYLP